MRKPHFGKIIDAARKHHPNSAPALSLLRFYPGETALATLKKALQDNEALIRYTALRTLERPNIS